MPSSSFFLYWLFLLCFLFPPSSSFLPLSSSSFTISSSSRFLFSSIFFHSFLFPLTVSSFPSSPFLFLCVLFSSSSFTSSSSSVSPIIPLLLLLLPLLCLPLLLLPLLCLPHPLHSSSFPPSSCPSSSASCLQAGAREKRNVVARAQRVSCESFYRSFFGEAAQRQT